MDEAGGGGQRVDKGRHEQQGTTSSLAAPMYQTIMDNLRVHEVE